jgi:hypothetical protein
VLVRHRGTSCRRRRAGPTPTNRSTEADAQVQRRPGILAGGPMADEQVNGGGCAGLPWRWTWRSPAGSRRADSSSPSTLRIHRACRGAEDKRAQVCTWTLMFRAASETNVLRHACVSASGVIKVPFHVPDPNCRITID